MVVLGACLIAWRLFPHDRLLLDHARRVAEKRLTGGKQLGFEYKNALYVVPVREVN